MRHTYTGGGGMTTTMRLERIPGVRSAYEIKPMGAEFALVRIESDMEQTVVMSGSLRAMTREIGRMAELHTRTECREHPVPYPGCPNCPVAA